MTDEFHHELAVRFLLIINFNKLSIPGHRGFLFHKRYNAEN